MFYKLQIYFYAVQRFFKLVVAMDIVEFIYGRIRGYFPLSKFDHVSGCLNQHRYVLARKNKQSPCQLDITGSLFNLNDNRSLIFRKIMHVFFFQKSFLSITFAMFHQFILCSFFQNIGNCTIEKEDDFYICLIKLQYPFGDIVYQGHSLLFLFKYNFMVHRYYQIIYYCFYSSFNHRLPLLSNYVWGCSFTCQDGLFKRHLLIL